MNFGWKTEEADSHAIMDRALAEGINFFDTANVYGFDAGKGRTEEVLGSWFAQGGERREKTVLATKVYGGMSRLAERHLPVRPQHRRAPATRRCGGCRPTGSTSTSSTTST